MKHAIVAMGLALALVSPALAESEQASRPADAPKERKICRSEQATGSIMPKRTCHTKEEWRQIDERNAANRDQLLDYSRQNSRIKS